MSQECTSHSLGHVRIPRCWSAPWPFSSPFLAFDYSLYLFKHLKDLAQENPPFFAGFPDYRCLLRKEMPLELCNYSHVNCVYLQCCWVSGAGPAHTATRSSPALCVRDCVLCGMQAHHEALGGFWGQSSSKFWFCLLCSVHPQMSPSSRGLCCFFVAPELLSSSWLSSQSFYSSEILCGSVQPLLRLQNLIFLKNRSNSKKQIEKNP